MRDLGINSRSNISHICNRIKLGPKISKNIGGSVSISFLVSTLFVMSLISLSREKNVSNYIIQQNQFFSQDSLQRSTRLAKLQKFSIDHGFHDQSASF